VLVGVSSSIAVASGSATKKLYGASLAEALSRPQHGGLGWLIVDARASGRPHGASFAPRRMGLAQKVFGTLNLLSEPPDGALARHARRALQACRRARSSTRSSVTTWALRAASTSSASRLAKLTAIVEGHRSSRSTSTRESAVS